MKKLRTEQEIMAKWKGEESQPLVSICCITYNHESYIEDAIEGFLIQETDFPFEILIHDDASTDRTADIIKEYEASYPTLLKPIYQAKNQYSKGKRPGFINMERALGKYIAFCEGDDYWIDPKKLQKQTVILNNHNKCSACFTNAIYINEIDSNRKIFVNNLNRELSLSIKYFLKEVGSIQLPQSYSEIFCLKMNFYSKLMNWQGMSFLFSLCLC